MANIQFGNSEEYERFYTIAHIATCVVCAILTLLVIFTSNGKVYIPIIFFFASLISFLNAYDTVHGIRRNKKAERKCILTGIIGVIMLILTVVSIVCFWVG